LFFIFWKKYVFSVKIFGVSGKFFSFSGKMWFIREQFLR
jgi:hypothetical protein